MLSGALSKKRPHFGVKKRPRSEVLILYISNFYCWFTVTVLVEYVDMH